MGDFKPFSRNDEEIFLRTAKDTDDTVPLPANDYVCGAIVDLFGACMSIKNACCVDTVTQRVNSGVSHNMQDHVDTLLQRHAETGQAEPDGAVVVVHCGHRTFDGMVAIRFIGPHKLARRKTLQARLDAACAEFGLDPMAIQEKDGFIPVQSFQPFLYQLDAKADASNHGQYNRLILGHNQRLNTSHLSLTLYMLRRCLSTPNLPCDGLPIWLVGHTVFRRCFSVVATDHENPGEIVLAATHLVCDSRETSNVVDGVQRFGRPSGSGAVVRFHETHNIDSVVALAPRSLWDQALAAIAFNEGEWVNIERWNNAKAALTGVHDLNQRRQILLDSFEMPDEVKPLFQAKNPMHNRARRDTELAQNFLGDSSGEHRGQQSSGHSSSSSDHVVDPRTTRCVQCNDTLDSHPAGADRRPRFHSFPCGHYQCDTCFSSSTRRCRGMHRDGMRARVEARCPSSSCLSSVARAVAPSR
jgi:hypothetical protein